MKKDISQYLKPDVNYVEKEFYYEFPIHRVSQSLSANTYYFNHPEWAEEYLTYCHRSESFKERWQTASGSWAGKVVLDIGCGPGNIQATLNENAEILIGVDVAPKSLEIARELGYTTVLADANNLPFKSQIADIVMLNAALHHTENMHSVLKEAARMVKPGGVLITDHDPQHSAWNYKGVAKLLWNARLVYYRYIGHSFHKSAEQQKWALACETHHQPGHGVTRDLFDTVLGPLGFEVGVYPHNHMLGKEVFEGKTGPVEFKYKLGNLLSGRMPKADSSALTLMCVAKRMYEEN